jgi:hypothetical protein
LPPEGKARKGKTNAILNQVNMLAALAKHPSCIS